MSAGTRRAGSGIIWPLLALAILLAFDAIFTPGFFHVELKDGHLFGSLIDILRRGSPVMLLSVGMTFVIATGGVDLSVGATTALAGAVLAVSLRAGHGWVMSLAGALLAALCAGLWNGVLVAWFAVQPIVATLVFMVAGRGLAQLLTDGQILPISEPTVLWMGNGFFLGLPVSIMFALATALLAGIAARKTATGLFIESVGNNALASQWSGISAARVCFVVYAFSALCAGLAGTLIAADIQAADVNNSGLYLELDAILAVVIGGTSLNGGKFSLPGSLVGALVIQTVTTTINTRGIAAEWALVLKAMIVLGVCLLHSEVVRGWFSRRNVAPGTPVATALGTSGGRS